MTFRCYTPHKVNKMCCSRKRDIKMKNNAVQKKTQYQEYIVHQGP